VVKGPKTNLERSKENGNVERIGRDKRKGNERERVSPTGEPTFS